jgi:acetyltransferase, GNAT family protein
VPTAYDTGTGTLPEYRGRGLAASVFEHSIPFLKAKGIQQYLLEVLQHNTKAVSVYRKLGFEVTREFNCFVQKNEAVRNEVLVPDHFTISQVRSGTSGTIPDFWDFAPSWQNSLESIRRVPEGLVGRGVFIDGKLAGYCVFEPASGDVTQLAVDRRFRRRGIASLLLREMTKLNRYETIKVINTDITCDSITRFLKAKNIGVTMTQFEMIKKI